MKNFLLIMTISLFLMSACKTTRDTKSQSQLKGSWTLTDVKYYNVAGVIIKAFDMQDALCFKESTWNFVPNNNTGNFSSLATSKCSALGSNFTWYITPEKEVALKFVGSEEKSKKVTQGYFLNLQNQTENSFEWVQKMAFEGKNIQIVYTFNKN